MYSFTEENYLKTIFHLSSDSNGEVNTNAIAEVLQTKPASVSDMLKKLAKKEAVNYVKYQGVTLTKKGRKEALRVVRKHRLWEVFLVAKLKFNWDEVHEIAEQLEHIESELLIERLDEFLGFPAYDPHGDPIPNRKGEFKAKSNLILSDAPQGFTGHVVSLKESSSSFLKFLDKIGIYIGAKIKITDRIEFDSSMELTIDGKKNVIISIDVSKNIFITE